MPITRSWQRELNREKTMKTIQELAKEACDVQDACNTIAVVGGMHRAMQSLMHDHNLFGDALSRHPVTVAWADKVASLTGVQGNSGPAFHAHGECARLAKG
jgi:phage gp16-like protein